MAGKTGSEVLLIDVAGPGARVGSGSFAARNREGKLTPAYARYIAITGNNFLSNTWRVSSEATTNAALARTGYGVLAEIASNAWSEFWPDVKRMVFKK